MKYWNDKILLLAICTVMQIAQAEDMWYPEGKHPIASVWEKIQRSHINASFSAIGSFVEVPPRDMLQPIDDSKGLIELQFQVEHRLDQGKPINSTVPLKLIVYRPLPIAVSNVDNTTLAINRKAERAISGNRAELQQYLEVLARARPPLLSAPGYLRDFLLVPIAVGALDAPYRVADVVVQFRKKYVVFVMRDISKAKKTPLFASDIDIYDKDEPEVLALLKSAE